MNKSVTALCSSSHQDLSRTDTKIILNIITRVCLTYDHQNGSQKECLAIKNTKNLIKRQISGKSNSN